jgi:glyoxylase-like metal-dependent hydrolase (beta-lactamase superfamily II)
MITIKKFVFNSFQVNTFILSDDSKEAIIIDPACETEDELRILIEYITAEEINPKAIVNTHAHIDHILGVKALKEYYKIPFQLHTNDQFLVETATQTAQIFGFDFDTPPVVDKLIEGEEELKFGNSTLSLFHVPGHSPGSIVFYSPEDKFAVVGDVLFKGSIGRTDLPGGSYETLITGIKEKLLTLPPETQVFCGHGPTTTIGQEHDTNPFLI